MQEKHYDKILQVVNKIYKNQDKFILLGMIGTSAYILTTAVRGCINLYDCCKTKGQMMCNNLSYCWDYINSNKRCPHCDKCYKCQKWLDKHLYQHELAERMHLLI